MKHFLPLLVFLFLLQSSQAQKEAAIWYFGNNAGLDFNSGAPVALTDGALRTDEGCATISNANGDLLFYTDGITVWNRNHQAMPNGTGLRGDPSSTQSAIIVPKPGSSTNFYVFTVDAMGGPDGLMYSEVDMTLNTSLGDVTALKNVQLATPVTEKLTAVNHANGTDIWVLAHGRYDNTFLAYLVTPAGVSATSINSNIGLDLSSFFLVDFSLGYLKASPDGTKVATCFFSNAVELYDFDDTTGTLSNVRTASDNTSRYFYGIEFSQNSGILYVSNFRDEIYQYDTNAANLENSEVLIFQKPGARFGGLQLALDGKIYLANRDRSYLSVIEQPDTPGLGCNFVEVGVDLNGRIARLGLPPFIQSFFQVAFTAENFCSGSPTYFELTTSETVLSVLWNFGDGNTSILETPSHTYSLAGTYTVEVSVTTATSTTTASKEITIFNNPVANTTADFEVCTVDPNHSFDLSTKDGEVLGTQSTAEFQVFYFSTLTGAQNNTNPLATSYTGTLGTETIYARIQNSLNPDCFDTTSFNLIVKQAPVLHSVVDWTICDTDSDGLYDFDLTQKDAEVLNGQNASTYTISYHNNQADADTNTNAIGSPYTNTTSPQTIYFRIQNTTYQECYETGNFQIEVITGVTANAPIDMVACDTDNDGQFPFDLSQTETEIVGTQNAASISITFHHTLFDAESGTVQLPKLYQNNSSYAETIYVRVQNTADASCYDTTSFQVQVYDAPIVQAVADWYVCDDNNDGFYDFALTDKDDEILGDQSTPQFRTSYYVTQADADASQNPIMGNYQNVSNPQSVFYRVENMANASCFLTGSFDLEVLDSPTASAPTPILVCDANETGLQTFDFTAKDVEVLNGQNPAVFEVLYFASLSDAEINLNPLPKQGYTNSAPNETIYVRVHHRKLESCFETNGFTLTVNPLPQPNLEETYVICPDSPELTIDGGDFESWIWYDESNNIIENSRYLNITSLGNYELTVSRTVNGTVCEKTVAFEVVSSGAPDDFTTEIKGFSDTVDIEIEVMGTGDFEYSIDGENFQDENRITVFPGTYTVHVRDKFLCRTISKEIIALGYQKFFTPNNDGSHDYWNVVGIENFPGSRLYIYDRYGKLLHQLLPSGLGWDGTYQGVQMPSTDYWFRFENEDGNTYNGHFTLKR